MRSSYDFVTITSWNKKIKRWQFNKGRTQVKVLVIPSRDTKKIIERKVSVCHLIALAAGKRFPTQMTSRIIKEKGVLRYHMIFQSGHMPDGKNVNIIATALIPKELFCAQNYVKNIMAGFWTGTPKQLAEFKFIEKTQGLTPASTLARDKVVIGRALIACEKKTKFGPWEFCDCKQESWITEIINKKKE